MKRFLILVATVLFLSACHSTPKISDNLPSKVFSSSLEKTKNAAVFALQANGFEVKKNEANYIEAQRPRKIGLFVGSGGETVGISLKSLEKNKTEVKLNTAKTFVGGAGQRNWNEQVINKMQEAINAKS